MLVANREWFDRLGKTHPDLQQLIRDAARDVTEEYNRDRRDLEDTQQQLLKELKLKMMVIENFVPPADRKKLLARAAYDEDEDTWYMTGPGAGSQSGSGMENSLSEGPSGVIVKRPVSAAGSRRPVSEYARMISGLQQGTAATRYRGENIMRLSLDRGGRTTREYEGPAVAPRVQAALDAAAAAPNR